MFCWSIFEWFELQKNHTQDWNNAAVHVQDRVPSSHRAFAGATVHDFFNWLSVLILLPLEVATGVLYKLTQVLIDSFNIQSGEDAPDLLNVITDPLTDSIVEVESHFINNLQVVFFFTLNKQWNT